MNEATKKLVEEVEGRAIVEIIGQAPSQACDDIHALCMEVRRLDEENERLRAELCAVRHAADTFYEPAD